jgi:hypothetical protein
VSSHGSKARSFRSVCRRRARSRTILAGIRDEDAGWFRRRHRLTEHYASAHKVTGTRMDYSDYSSLPTRHKACRRLNSPANEKRTSDRSTGFWRTVIGPGPEDHFATTTSRTQTDHPISNARERKTGCSAKWAIVCGSESKSHSNEVERCPDDVRKSAICTHTC